jgi:leucyl-tRNA synthetase
MSYDRQDAIRKLVLIVSPMIPHIAEELWKKMGGEGLIADAAWPAVDPTLLVEDEVTIAVQVMGKVRDTITVARGQSEEANTAIAMTSSKVRFHAGEEPPRRVIYVPDRLINIIPGRIMKKP